MLSLGLGLAVVIGPASPAAAALPDNCTFDPSTGSVIATCDFASSGAFIVPAGVSQLSVIATGAAGEDFVFPGGAGAVVTATVPATAGATYSVIVGEGGGLPRGGGASGLLTGSDASTAMVYAGGGGGAGIFGAGGRGGPAGLPTGSSPCAAGTAGTAGSTPPPYASNNGTGGGAGTCVAGSAAGISLGASGALGAGGAGATGYAGGGGGAGYYGGGGGGSWAGGGPSNAGGGGGGSSYVATGATGISSMANASTSASVSVSFVVPVASVTITTASSTIIAPDSATFSVEGFDGDGASIGDLTAASVFTITGAGSCSAAVCTGPVGSYVVTATYGGFSAQAPLTINAPPPPPSTIAGTASTTSLAQSGTVTVSASGFRPGEQLQVWLNSTPVLLATGTASAEGTFTRSATIPADAEVGAHQLEIRGAESGSVFIDVSVAAALAATGSASTAPALAGAMLMVIVGGALLVARGRVV